VAPQYEIGAQYAIWDDSGLVQKNFADIVTFTRASTATYFNSAGTLTSAAVDEARFDYNPSTLAAQGLLIEESRTNSIRNNTMVGAVAGTPGTLPTNWTILGIGLGTLTQQVVGTGTTNGIDYIDYRVSGTTSTTGFTLSFEQAAQIVAVNGQTWASSAWASLIGGSTTNINALNLAIDGRTAAGAFVGVVNGLNLLGVTPTLTRYTSTGTIANASVERVVLGIAFGFASGVAIDITLRIGLPQLELGAFATSVIPTTTTALTRSADVASVNTLSPWYNASAGTIYAEFALTQPVSGGNQFLARVSDNSYNNSIADNVSGTGFAAIATASGGVFDGTASTAVVVSANTTTKFAGAYAANDLAACKDGGVVATDSTATIPSGLTRFDLGSDHAGANRVKAGYLRRITYYPRRLSNADLQAITA
jgi:hypothetical protein